MPLPTDNRVINFIWIGAKPLPQEELTTLLSYAHQGTLPVILWVDSPQQMRTHLATLGLSTAAIQALAIHSIDELFAPEANAVHEEKWTNLLNAMQAREQYGEGNIGARVDLIKAQIAYRVGGIYGDFDTLAAIQAANGGKTRPTLEANLRIAAITQEFLALIQQNTLLYRTETGQPDIFASSHHSADAQLLRELQIQIATIHATTEHSVIMTPSANANPSTLSSQDPLGHSPREGRASDRDIRRSYQGWQETIEHSGFGTIPIAKDLTIKETGSLFLNFIGFKLMQQMADALAQLGTCHQQLAAKERECAQHYHSLKELTCSPAEAIKIKNDLKVLYPAMLVLKQTIGAIEAQYSQNESAFKRTHTIDDAFSGLFHLPDSVYQHSWVKDAATKPTAYTLEDQRHLPCQYQAGMATLQSLTPALATNVDLGISLTSRFATLRE